MAHFPIVREAEASDPLVVAIYNEIRQELGFGIVPNIFKSMAIRPTLLRVHWDKFRATILQGYLPRTIKEMIGILISQANHSQYAMQVHMHGLSAMGMSEEVLQALVRDFNQCPLPEREKKILHFGLRAATDPLSITAADYDALRAADVSDEEIFEVVATADLFSSINAYTDAAGVEIDKL